MTITREQALQWAKEAGLWNDWYGNDWYAEMWKKENAPRMEVFAALVEQHVRAELDAARLRKALEKIAEWDGYDGDLTAQEMFFIARDALKGTP